MSKRQDRLDRFMRIDGEFRAASRAVKLLLTELRRNPSFGKDEHWRQRDAQSLQAHLESTYIVRLFAEFEAGLRDAWVNHFRRNRPTRPDMQPLIDAVGRRVEVPHDWLAAVHRVRRHRNAIVHEGGQDGESIGFFEARTACTRFFSRLPVDW